MGGLKLERYKFLIYLIVPVGSVYLFSIPSVHEFVFRTRPYIVYESEETSKQRLEDAMKVVEAHRAIARVAAAAAAKDGEQAAANNSAAPKQLS